LAKTHNKKIQRTQKAAPLILAFAARLRREWAI
jgi:hypothetical protein